MFSVDFSLIFYDSYIRRWSKCLLHTFRALDRRTKCPMTTLAIFLLWNNHQAMFQLRRGENTVVKYEPVHDQTDQ